MGITTTVRSISAESPEVEDVAEVISQAFAADPLILWLLDDQGPTWDKLEPSLQRWQQFRVEDAAINGVVLGAFQTGESSTQETCRGAVLMFPTSQRQPIQVMKRTMQYGYLKWYWKRFSIGMDAPNTNQQRWQHMMAKHNEGIQTYTHAYSDYCYLEVIASHPAAKGTGIGKALMSAVIEEAQGSAIILECTDETTIPFYTKFGFSEVGRVELKDDQGSTAMWMMVRKPE
ncbi:hypothetical protein LTS17_005938 [Exophiala oligosperma]